MTVNLDPVLLIKFSPECIELNVLEVDANRHIVVVAHHQLPTSPLPQWTQRELDTTCHNIKTFFGQVKTNFHQQQVNVTLVVPALWYQHKVVTVDRTLDQFRSVREFTTTKVTDYLRRHGQIDATDQSLFYMMPALPARSKWDNDHYLAYFMAPTHLKLMLNLMRSLRVKISQIIPDLETWSHFFATNYTPIKNYLTLLWTDNVIMLSEYEQGQVHTTQVQKLGLKVILQQLAVQYQLPIARVRAMLRLSSAHFTGESLAEDVPGGLVRQFLTLLTPQFRLVRDWMGDGGISPRPILVVSPLTQTAWGRHLLQQQLGPNQFFWGHSKLDSWSFFDWAGTWGAFSLYQELVYKYRFFDHQPLSRLLPSERVNWGWRSLHCK